MKTNYLLLQVVLLLLITVPAFASASPSVSVAFVLDESGSISASNFELETEGFQEALSSLSTDGSIEVSILGFSDSVETLIEREVLTSSTYNSINSALEGNTQAGRSTYMSAAIDTASNILQGSSAPTRIICMATDGYPDSPNATETAADNAKTIGIILAPIGVALDTDGKLFLDGIASNPPVPNPADFEEFAEVVVNVCVGEVYASLNIQFTPDTVSFGSYSEQLVGDASGSIATKYVEIENLSSKYAYITDIKIIGNNASSFNLISFMYTDASEISNYYPITFSSFHSSQIEIDFAPQESAPENGEYSASLSIAAENADGTNGDFVVNLEAFSVPTNDDSDTNSLQVLPVVDAKALIYEISDTGEPLGKDGFSVINELNVSALVNDESKAKNFHRNGLVADGNARLLLVAQTQNATDTIRFEMVNPDLTEARLYPLAVQPTYKVGTNTYDDTGRTSIDLNVTRTDNSSQVTAVLRAGERFLGDGTEQNYSINVCLTDENGNCGQLQQKVSVIEKKAPVVLVHGLWSNVLAWFDEHDSSKGLASALAADGHRYGFISYDGDLGPSDTVNASKRNIYERVNNLCSSMTHAHNVACTRVDMIGHSMGGLFIRELIRQKIHNDKSLATFSLSFGQGVIRRVITMGTPHFGSPLANLLWADTIYQALSDEQKKNPSDHGGLAANNEFINSCIENPSLLNPGGGYDEIEDLVANLASEDKIISTGIRDLALGSAFQDLLNTSNVSTSYYPPIFVIAGNVGEEYDQSLTKGRVKKTANVTTVRFHTIGNAERAGCYYEDVLQNDSDGIVATGSGLLSEDYLHAYDLSHYSSSSIATDAIEVNGFYHTNMGKQFPFLGENGEVDVSREDLSMIEQVITYLSSELPQ